MGNDEVVSIEQLVEQLKEELFSSDLSASARMSASAYDTAWVAMVPKSDVDPGDGPMFPGCLQWVLHNQKDGGFWGEPEPGTLDVLPTVECLTATVTCMAALKKWNTGSSNIARGLEFLQVTTNSLLEKYKDNIPRWFIIVFPGIIEIAFNMGLTIFPEGYSRAMKTIFNKRQTLLNMEDPSCQGLYPPLASYLEVLEDRHVGNQEEILSYKSIDGSLFQSPSTTAFTFIKTKDEECLQYLNMVVGSRENDFGVSGIHPLNEDYMRISLIDQIERLGCAEHFKNEIKIMMHIIYKNWTNQEERHLKNSVQYKAHELYQDALAFRLLRLHGYQVSPRRICWFLNKKEILQEMEENHTYFKSIMYNIYRASDILFLKDFELQRAGAFTRKLLQKQTPDLNWNDGIVVSTNFINKVKHELNTPWITKMDHQEYRNNIESDCGEDLLIVKASFCRLSLRVNAQILLLARKNFMFRQSIYKVELEDMHRWSKKWELSTIGFGREKTAYLYYVAATGTSLPSRSDARKICTKCGVLVTVADDFFDFEGTLNELHSLVNGIERWNGEALSGNSKIIFDALDNLVEDITTLCYESSGHDVKNIIQNIWIETFKSWLIEAEWSRTRHSPSVKEYIKVGMISIAIQAMILPACYVLHWQEIEQDNCNLQYKDITILTMILSRFINDIQSYQKERDEGKMNMVFSNMKEYSLCTIDDSIAHIKILMEIKRREVLELILMDDESSMPKPWKEMHLLALKAFHMLYQSDNIFDSETALIPAISRAFYDPLHSPTSSY